MIEEEKNKNENNNFLNEPAASYEINKNSFQETPSFVLEDFRIGMKQYLEGKCINAQEFMLTLNNDV